MGSCENSVIVDEPVCLSISGQHLCSEFPAQSVSKQQFLRDSDMDRPDLVSSNDTTCLCSGHIPETYVSAGMHEMADVLALENLLKNDCRESGVCLNENRDACDVETGGECLKVGRAQGEESLGNSTGDYGDSKVCLNENHGDTDVCHVETSEECLKEGRAQGEDGLGNLTRDYGDSRVCLNENHSGVDVCDVETNRECLKEGMAQREDGLGNLTGNDGDSRVCLNDNHSEAEVSNVETSGECLKEGMAQGEDGLGNLTGDCANCRVCFKENHSGTTQGHIDVCDVEIDGECLKEGRAQGEDGLGNLIGDFEDGRVCLNENHNDIDVCDVETSGECLKEGRAQGEDGLGNLTGDYGDNRICLNENYGGIDVCDVETGGDCLKEGMAQSVDGLRNQTRDNEIPLEAVPETDLPKNCVQQVEQKDDNNVSCVVAEEFTVAVEDKDNVSIEVNNGFCEQKSPLQDCESSELVPKNGLLGNTLKQKEQDVESVCGLSLGTLIGKMISLAGLEEGTGNKILSLQHGEMSFEVSHAGNKLSSCDRKNNQNNCIRVSSSERNSEAGGMESNIDMLNHVSPLMSLKNVQKFDSPHFYVQQCEEIDDKSVDVLFKERVTEFVEEKSDVTMDANIEVGPHILPIENNACNLHEGFYSTEPKFVLDKCGSLQSCQPLIVDDGTFEGLDVSDQLGNGIHGPLKSTNALDSSTQTDNQGKDIEKIDCVFEMNCCDIVSSSSQRNVRRGRSNRKVQTKKAARRNKKTTKASCSRGSVKIAFKARKKRSCLSKSARSSAWGLLGNVSQLFEHSNGLEITQVLNQGSRKSKGGKKSGKQDKNGATKRSKGSRRKSGALNTNIRLKVKLGKKVCSSSMNVMVPEVVDTSALSTAVSSDFGTEVFSGSPKLANGIVNNSGKGETAMHFKCLSNDSEKAKSCPGAFLQDDVQLVDNGQESNVVTEKSDADVRDYYFGVSPNTVVQASEGATDSRCKDPGTSPDSEVINLSPGAQVDSKPPDDFHGTINSPKDLAASGDLASNKRGTKKNKLSGLLNGIAEDKPPHLVKMNKAKPLKQYGRKQNSNNGICSSENHISLGSTIASSYSSSDKEPSIEPLHLSKQTVLTVSTEGLKVDSGAEANIHCNLGTGASFSKSLKSGNSLRAKIKGHKLTEGKSQGSDSGIKRVNYRSKEETQRRSAGKKKTKGKPVCGHVTCNVESQPEAESHMVDGIGKTNSGEHIVPMDLPNLDVLPGGLGEQYLPSRNAWVRCDDCHKWRRIPSELADAIEETQCTWTCKDNMDKDFADCSTPQEKSNADINAELEISDASGEEDASGTRLNYKGLECRHPKDLQKTATCISIRTNQYLHRNRKTQTIDEIMVCDCKPPPDSKLGCGDGCLNRILNVECVQGACPCRELCSNQQFQKRKYAKLEKFRCGKKGYGLKLLEDISEGQFLIEYVGEVLDMQAYEARQKEYALKGHKHFYFMTLNGPEVIDACIKGNKGRFINHSCDPNCRTEKWMVNGEICIGIFALRDIKKGEEVTFDYNYVRVFGAAAKKCYCGSPQCRGYIGGDPLNSEVIVESDLDEDYPEPLMLPDDGDAENIIRKASSSNGVITQISEIKFDKRDERDKCISAPGQSEISTGRKDSINHSASAVSLVHDTLELDSKGKLTSSIQTLEIFQQTEDVTSKLTTTVQQESSIEEGSPEKSSSSLHSRNLTSPVELLSKDAVDGNRKSKSDAADDRQLSSKAHPKTKTSRPSSIVKKGKVKSNSPNATKVQLAANKSQVLHIKSKKVIHGSFGSHFEAVEEKLNELLDTDGGISKRKDAPKGYLKLLYLTATSGDSANGEAIQRNRDVSMILDALLKTKSRVVLNDIINKNGLRMLHTLLKLSRKDFKKIPILRKLLKVFEYLAVREILTSDHINEGPPCPGMESFKESFLSLTEHDDRQVHQIARNFRDRWIPKHVRKNGYADRDEKKKEFLRSSNCNRFSATQNNRSDHAGRYSEAIDCVKQSVVGTTSVDACIQEGSPASSVGVSPNSGTKARKRKSRWDQPVWDHLAETNSNLSSFQHKEQTPESKQFESSSFPRIGEPGLDNVDTLNREDRNCIGYVNDYSQLDKADIVHDGKQNAVQDVPPGFSSPSKPPLGSSLDPSTIFHSKCPFNTVIGHPQEKFISRLPVSYGIPLSIMQQFGTPHAETAGSWVVAPGMPFHPFPPLPPFPRGKKDHLPSEDVNRSSVCQLAEEEQLDSHLPANSHSNETPSTTGNGSDADISCTTEYSLKRGRGSSHDLGRRYFKQQKWNNTKVGPPWHWRKNGWGCMGNSRGGTSSISIENSTNELRSTYCSEDLSCRVEQAGNNCYQHPEHHSQH